MISSCFYNVQKHLKYKYKCQRQEKTGRSNYGKYLAGGLQHLVTRGGSRHWAKGGEEGSGFFCRLSCRLSFHLRFLFFLLAGRASLKVMFVAMVKRNVWTQTPSVYFLWPQPNNHATKVFHSEITLQMSFQPSRHFFFHFSMNWVSCINMKKRRDRWQESILMWWDGKENKYL